jgi:epoxyqueuosine reductase
VNAGESSEDLSILKDIIKAKADELGFAKCGITTAHPPPNHNRYKAWLDSGMAGELHYLHRQEEKRQNLAQVMPGIKTLVVVAMNYYSGDSPHSPHEGVVARYARFPDYHHTMWERLEQLLNFIRGKIPGAEGKAYCDTGPITERDYAMRAGIGWIGKHTNLINRNLGNWFFLGELLLDFELPPDQPETPHCGTCTRCMPACPTGAIVRPFELDARRCISYLTIELKGSIPVPLRPLVGNRIYGCDDCLAVCPWNKFAVKSNDRAVRPRQDLLSPDLASLLTIDEKEFKSRFHEMPMMRAKRRGFVRNVCVALGNVGDSNALPQLAKATKDHEPLVQEHAEWAINQINLRSESR